MYVKLNARGQIVEATDATQGNEYTEVAGSVATNMPDSLLGFNGTVQTPNYTLVGGAVVDLPPPTVSSSQAAHHAMS